MTDKIDSAVSDRYSGHSVAITNAEVPASAARGVECKVNFWTNGSGNFLTAGSCV